MNPKDDLKDVFDGGGIKPQTWIHLGCYAALVLVLLVALKSWKDESVGRARAEATAEVSAKIQKDAQAAMDARDKVWEQRLAELQKENREIRSLKQAVQVVEKYVPVAAPQQVKAEELRPETAAKLPESPDGYTIRTGLQEMALAKSLNECEQVKGGLSKCEADKADIQKQLEAEKTKSKEWEKAARGGSKWRRFGAALKWLGVGLGIGATLGIAR